VLEIGLEKGREIWLEKGREIGLEIVLEKGREITANRKKVQEERPRLSHTWARNHRAWVKNKNQEARGGTT